ncbi:MAG: ComF family protein [Thermodesulfobacteriota bacterium]
MLSSLLEILLPKLCPLCRDSDSPSLKTDGLCAHCLAGFKKVSKPVCSICGAPFVSSSGPDHLCAKCIKTKRPFVKARSALYYTDEGAEAIKRFKYHGVFSLKPAFDNIFYALLDEFRDVDLIIPVPLHRRRLAHRGFNQSLILARLVAKRLNKKLDYTTLKRVRLTRPQTELKGEERKRNVRGAFEVSSLSDYKDKKLLLVDDVYTTGSTVSECARVLKRAGGVVSVLTLARSARV